MEIGKVVVTNVEAHWTAGNGRGSTDNKIRRFLNLRKDTSQGYFTMVDTAANGLVITINVAGYYAFTWVDSQSSGAGGAMGISVNATLLTTSIATLTYAQGKRMRATQGASAGYLMTCSGVLYLAKGDVIRCHDNGSCNEGSEDCYFSIACIG